MLESKVMTMDDFGAEWKHVSNLEEIKRRIPNLKITLFTIPAYHNNELKLIDDKRYVDWIFNNRDWIEIASHGYHHNGWNAHYGSTPMDKNIIEGKGIVEGKRTYDQQYELMKKGLTELERFMPPGIRGYKSPGNHMNSDTVKVLENLSFQYYMFLDTIYLWDLNSARQFKRFIPVHKSEHSPHIQTPLEYEHWFDIDFNNTKFMFVSEQIHEITNGRI